MRKQPTQATLTLSRKRRRRVLFASLAVCLGLGIALCVCEIALRVYVASRGWTANCYVTGLVFFVPDQYSGHTLRPGLRLKSSTYDIRVNTLGLRGEEISLQKPPNTTRIAVLGGSSVFGYLVPNGQDSCYELQKTLQNGGHQVEVLNGGVPGFNMMQCRYRYEQLIAPFEPDFVLLYLGWNDMRFLIAEDPSTLDKVPSAAPLFQRVLAQSVLYGFTRYRLFPAKAPRFAPPPAENTRVTEAGRVSFEGDLLALIDTIRESGAQPVISTQVMASNFNCDGLDNYLGNSDTQVSDNRIIGQWITEQLRLTSRAYGIPLIDCANEIPCNQSILGDAIHLTHKGHQAVARFWASEMDALLHAAELQTEVEEQP